MKMIVHKWRLMEALVSLSFIYFPWQNKQQSLFHTYGHLVSAFISFKTCHYFR